MTDTSNTESKTQQNMLRGNPLKVFVSYAVPSVVGILAISSAETVDAIFVGNFAGALSLAAVNLVLPYFFLVFGFGVMIITGSSVRIGKYLGEGDTEAASSMFTRTIIVLIITSLLVTIIGVFFPDYLVKVLGGRGELVNEAAVYLSWISGFTLFYLGAWALYVFVKVDGRPVLGSAALIAGALANFALDWFLVAELRMGVRGAAIATGTSQIISMIILACHFVSRQNRLRFRIRSGRWKEIFQACYNGISEFINEISAGIVILIFNWIMVSRMGVAGVAAFSVINYTMGFALMLSYGISESLLPLVSTNFGARQPGRIRTFILSGSVTVTVMGFIFFLLFSLAPEMMIGIFLESSAIETAQIALVFIGYVKWAFLFSGLNMVLSAYFTAMHKPMESAAIAFSRSLLIPVAALITLPFIFGDTGIYATIPLAEFLTLALAGLLLIKNLPSRLVSLLPSTPSQDLDRDQDGLKN